MKNKYHVIIAVLFFSGIILRLAIAYIFFGSHEVVVWHDMLRLLKAGENIYTAHPGAYPYSPLFIYIFYIFEKVFYFLPSYFVVKLPMIFGDILTGWIIFLITKRLGYAPQKQCVSLAFFMMNPVSILTSAFNASFGNISVMLVLAGLYVFSLRIKFQNVYNIILYTLSLAFKHFTIFFVPLYFFLTKGKKTALLFILPAIFLPLAFFGFYDKQSIAVITHSVFTYAGYSGLWGYTQMLSNIQNFTFSFLPLTNTVFLSVAKFFFIFAICAVSFWAYRRYSTKVFSVFDAFFTVLLAFLVFTAGFGSDYYVWIVPFAAIANPMFTVAYSVTVTLVKFLAIYWFYLQGGATHAQQEIIGFLNYFPYLVCVYFFLLWIFRHRARNQKKFILFFSTGTILIFLLSFIVSSLFFQPKKEVSSGRSSYALSAEYLQNFMRKEDTIFVWDNSPELFTVLKKTSILPSVTKYAYLLPSENFEFPNARIFDKNIFFARENLLSKMQSEPPTIVVIKFGGNMRREYDNFPEFFENVFKRYSLNAIFDDLWIYRYNGSSGGSQKSTIRFEKDSGDDFVSEFIDRPSGIHDHAMIVEGVYRPVVESSIETKGKIWKSPFIGKDRPIFVKVGVEETRLYFEGVVPHETYKVTIKFLGGSFTENAVYEK